MQQISFFIVPRALKIIANVSGQGIYQVGQDICVFWVELFKRIEVIVISRTISDGVCSVSFFDKEVIFEYGTYLYIDLKMLGVSLKSAIFDIHVEHTDYSGSLGKLEVYSSGDVTYNGVPIGTSESKRMCVKAALLG